jgi:hypothetical protein
MTVLSLGSASADAFKTPSITALLGREVFWEQSKTGASRRLE